MLPKSALNKKSDQRNDVIVIPSRIGPVNSSSFEEIEATEIAAEILVTPEGGWGWVIVMASFYNAFILDGIFFTFGSVFADMVEDLEVGGTLVALLNSTAVSLLFLTAPLVSALINRFGFRAIAMTGSIVVAFAFVCAYFSSSYLSVLISYGIISGIGASFIGMPSILIVGFYFERLRAIAYAIAGTGSSMGMMIMFAVNSLLVGIAGWRITMLLHSGLIGTIFFSTMTFRPLLSLTVIKTTEEPTRTVTYLPSLSTAQFDNIHGSPSRIKTERLANATERLFSAISNSHFPTAASVVEEGIAVQSLTGQAESSAPNVSKLTLIAKSPQGGISQRQIKQVQSIISRATSFATNKDSKGVEVTMEIKGSITEPSSKKRWWTRLFHWEKHLPESRPMYRDDAFYEGDLENLPVYQKSVMETPPEARIGIEYQLAVSRAVTTTDIRERRGVFTTAVRRILATMMDPKLLKRPSFLLMCSSGFLVYIGLLIPYVFLTDRNMGEGIHPYHCSLFVSVISLFNIVGRLLGGVLAYKFDVAKLYPTACIISGMGTMAYNFSFNIYYQYLCCVIFGIFVAFISSLRSTLLVLLYGLDKLTNATGMILMFQGIGCIISTPLSNIIKDMFGYTVSFYFAGVFIVVSGVILLPIKGLAKREAEKEAQTEDVKI